MIVAVVEDNEADAALVRAFLKRYGDENGERFEVSSFTNGLDFVGDYAPVYDIVLLDIEMPLMNGLDAAKKIRDVDGTVAILFITNMMQYAIRGYEVGAVDFLVKPVGYGNFADKFKKAMGFAARRDKRTLLVQSGDRTVKIFAGEVAFAEKEKNYVVFHTADGDYRRRELLQDAEEALDGLPFSKCNSGCLVNFRYIDGIGKDDLIVAGKSVPLARRRKQEFLAEYMKFLGGKNK